SGTRSARTPDTLPTKIVEHKTRGSTHSETISKGRFAWSEVWPIGLDRKQELRLLGLYGS
ncbi:hypothetical protein, partial [Streptomyces coeruleorubidus]|uniref:hypothetical protein n=1 Tax=Streptomyces coeruleorubidus TaxID=116188 RepID=UPI003410A678